VKHATKAGTSWNEVFAWTWRSIVFNDCICFQLGAVGRKITRYYREKVISVGMTHGQLFSLVALYDEDVLLPIQLATKQHWTDLQS
jgi:hypothetical protein